MEISRLERVPLREVWHSEERDFTPWLEKNIELLSEVLGIPLSVVEREKKAGVFKADILAESNSDPVVIECQFGKSDHGHLGKILTYLTQLDAKVVVWICEDPRPEHVNVISWLNESTDVSFYLVKLEVFRIGNSLPAPHFLVLSRPSSVMEAIGEMKKELTRRHRWRLEFWKGLLDKSKSRGVRLFENIKPSKENWIGTGAGKSGLQYAYVILMNSSRVELYIDTGNREENKKIFDKLYSQKEEIEKEFGGELDWQRLNDKRACRIAAQVSKHIGLKDEDKWDRIQDDMIDTMIRFEKAFRKRILNL